jgi:hypothetical protein
VAVGAVMRVTCCSIAAALVLMGCLSFQVAPCGEGGASCYAQAVLADAPVAYWRFDELTGSTAADEVGAHPGTYEGVEQGAPGALTEVDAAIRFAATGARVAFGDAFDFAADAPFSIEVWLKVEVADTTFRYAVDKGGTDAAGDQGWAISVRSAGVGFDMSRDGQYGSGAVFVPVTLNTFMHYVVTFDGQVRRAYGNGALVDTSRLGGTVALADTAFPMVAGGDPIGGGDFRGVLDELAVYDHALTAERIAAHHDAASSQ